MTSAATFEVGEVMVFGSEGFARVEAVGEKVALGRTQSFSTFSCSTPTCASPCPSSGRSSVGSARSPAPTRSRTCSTACRKSAGPPSRGTATAASSRSATRRAASRPSSTRSARWSSWRAPRSSTTPSARCSTAPAAPCARDLRRSRHRGDRGLRARRRPARRGRLTRADPPWRLQASPGRATTRRNRLLAADANALLIGFVLDQQVPVQKAFSGPQGAARPARPPRSGAHRRDGSRRRSSRCASSARRSTASRPRWRGASRSCAACSRATTTATARASGPRPPTAPTCTRASARCPASAT